MRLKESAALLVLMLALTACGGKTWKEFTSIEGGFSVQMPGTPKVMREPLPSPQGVYYRVNFVVEDEETQWAVSYTNRPTPFREEVVLNQPARTLFFGARGRVMSDQKISLDGVPGREVRMEVGSVGRTMILRVYVTNGQLIEQTANTLSKNADSADVAKFLGSFKLNRR